MLAWQATWKTFSVGPEIPVNQSLVAQAQMRIDPNTASYASLRRLHGVGPVLAMNIIGYRGKHGPRPFASAQDLDNVPKIGPSLILQIQPYLSLPCKEGDSALQDEPPEP